VKHYGFIVTGECMRSVMGQVEVTLRRNSRCTDSGQEHDKHGQKVTAAVTSAEMNRRECTFSPGFIVSPASYIHRTAKS